MIYKWVDEAGLKGNVCTMYEILQGDDTANQGKEELLTSSRIPWFRD
jgi:hypothetical protein